MDILAVEADFKLAIRPCARDRRCPSFAPQPFGAGPFTDELLQLWDDTQFTVMFVTHSIAEAIRIGNRILLLSAHPGRVRAQVRHVEQVSADDGSAAQLEQQIHDLLFAETEAAAQAEAKAESEVHA